MKMRKSSGITLSLLNLRNVIAVLALTAGVLTVQAQSIAVPNYSFESQSGVGWPFGTNPNVDNWQKIAEPPWFAGISGGQIPWYGTAGVFIDSNPYTNAVGTQAGYMLAFPQVALFQDYSVSSAFNATFEIGKAYNLTVGVFGKGSSAPLAPGATLTLSLYYRNGAGDKVTIASTPVVYNAATFPTGGPLGFVDYTVNLTHVQATDAWAGQYIGIQLESTIPFELTTGGNWDFDNVRLTAVPEPTTLALLGLGLGGVFMARRRRG